LRALGHHLHFTVLLLLEKSGVVGVKILHDKLFGLNKIIVESGVGQGRVVNKFSQLRLTVGADHLRSGFQSSHVRSELAHTLRLLAHSEGVLGEAVFVAVQHLSGQDHDSIKVSEILLQGVDMQRSHSLDDLYAGFEDEHFLVCESNFVLIT